MHVITSTVLQRLPSSENVPICATRTRSCPATGHQKVPQHKRLLAAQTAMSIHWGWQGNQDNGQHLQRWCMVSHVVKIQMYAHNSCCLCSSLWTDSSVYNQKRTWPNLANVWPATVVTDPDASLVATFICAVTRLNANARIDNGHPLLACRMQAACKRPHAIRGVAVCTGATCARQHSAC